MLISACATTQNQEQICAAPSLEQASEKAVKRMAKDARKPLRALEKLSGAWETDEGPSRRDIVKLDATMEDLRVKLKEGRGMYRLKNLVQKCDAPTVMSNSLSHLFENQNLQGQLTQTVKALPIYTYMLDSPQEHWRPTEVQLDIPLPRMEDF